jgi:hypothetical protein
MPKKRQKHCMHIKPHKAHTWEHVKQSPIPGAVRTHEKVYCPGVGQHHVHVWDANSYPIMRRPDGKVAALGEAGVPVTGPFECVCGASAWLHDGYKKRDISGERFPLADPMERILALKAKLAAGKELDEADKKELNEIADALIEAFKPIAEALAKLAVQVGEYITAFLDRVDFVKIAEMVELSKAYGEKPDAVETVTLMGDNMEPVEIVVAGAEAVPASAHAALPTEIVEDSLQADFLPHWVDEPQAEQASDGEYIRTLPDHMQPAHVPDVIVNVDGSLTPMTAMGERLVQPRVEVYPRQSGKNSYGGR